MYVNAQLSMARRLPMSWLYNIVPLLKKCYAENRIVYTKSLGARPVTASF